VTIDLLFAVVLLHGRDRLPLDTPLLHLLLELVNIADSGKEMRLSTSVAIKGSKPLVPLFLGSLGFLEIANDWIFQRREESVVGNLVVGPAIAGAGNVVVRLSFQPSALVQI